MKPLNILTWHVHGSYLNSLARLPHNWFLPVTAERGPGYGGRGASFDLPDNMREVPAERVRELNLDVILFQSPQNYQQDQYDILSAEQRRLPKIYLEHNTPRPHPTDTAHVVDDPDMLLVHVTHFNRLMWDNCRTPTTVIEHSVAVEPAAIYSGWREQGIAVVNCMQRRPRIAGLDIFNQARERVPLTLAGMETAELGGLGDVPYRHLHRVVGEYRFLFSPMRYTSLPLAVIEAMTIGMPVVALATTEVPAVIEHGVHGYVSCDVDELVARMQALLADRGLAQRLGSNARALAHERFGMERFIRDWNKAFQMIRD
ncbi:MAG: glycosyltransferase family 4 protein [Chloroflexaceae bacterium]|jgi:glycosyltransferase involved in cell wall biosynthesis|nr:glycosyltransferase family 4 protein [Chloroflexaceae bacterium]